MLRAGSTRKRLRAIRSSPTCSSMPASSGAIRCRPLEWLSRPHDWAERTKAYLEGASALFVQTARAALDRAGITARDVDVIVTVSSTGIATPSLEARVAAQMGFRPSATRVPVFGLGCAGGVSGLSIGARLARAEPGEIVLVVVVELCTLAFRDRSRDQSRRDFVGAVRRWRCCRRVACGPRQGRFAHRRGSRAHLAQHARHHGLDHRSGRLSGRAVALAAALCRAAAGCAGAPLRESRHA